LVSNDLGSGLPLGGARCASLIGFGTDLWLMG
jgi:hypothetical protein